MSPRVIIISPDRALSGSLGAALTHESVGADLHVVSIYPIAGGIKTLVDSGTQPVTAFVVGLADIADGLKLIRELRAAYPGSLAIAADSRSDANTILAAMRAGASEFLVPPFDINHLQTLLQGHASAVAAPPAKPRGKLFCILPAQGGNGASTIAVHLADRLSKAIGEKVLLVDFDFHSGTVAFRLRLKPEFSFADAVARVEDIDELWARLTCNHDGVDILAAPPPGIVIPAQAFRHVSAVFTSAMRAYPFVMVDLPTAIHASCRDLLSLADAVYVVATPEVVALHLARRRVSDLTDLGLSQRNIHLILNRAGSKRALNVDDVAEVVGVPVFETLTNDYSSVSDAALKGGLVPDDSSIGRQLTALAGLIAGVETAKSTKSDKKWNLFSFN
jgi:pilus assembly protein CpaE